MRLILLLAIIPFAFVNAQQPVYWELHENWTNNQWVNTKFYDYMYNQDNILIARYNHVNWNENLQRWDYVDSYTYSLNQCDSLVDMDYQEHLNTNSHTDYYRTNDCDRIDSLYNYQLFNLNPPFNQLRKTKYLYDSSGRKIKTISETNTPSPYGPYYNTTTWQFDTLGNLTGQSKSYTPPYPDGQYSGTGITFYYNNSQNYYASLSREFGQNSSNSGGDWYFYPYNNKLDSTLYYYNQFNTKDSLYTYKSVDINDTTEVWSLTRKILYKYTLNQKLDSIKLFDYQENTQQWQKDTLSVYEYDVDNLYRITLYHWQNNSWNNVKRITYGYLPTSISETPIEKPFTIFPNPAINSVTIGLDKTPAKPIYITIYSTIGQQMLSLATASRQTEIPVTTLSPGLYHAVINNNGELQKSTFTVID